ncbi:uncharacterized protein N7518_000131 [Penicillium psychrosexuale]|uniref:uncharacterized protein n=1 Tax=Penicillium psychrosexuale TaxID=1002107 RepID=UPI0025457CE1|nr:uncharacterized protein N7518_000131 [Penicillium psychrosexuale]KAJ5803828.1 hypothetical protein N7518_000131 [Penicillium psychrosexuale]
MADFIMPRIACQDIDALSSDKETKPLRESCHETIYLDTLWCLQCFRFQVSNWNDDRYPFYVMWGIEAGSPQKCCDCKEAGYKYPAGYSGHVFELMALIEFAKRYWTDNGGIGGVPMHVRARCEDVPEEHFPALFELFTAFDDLVETHMKAHMLTGNVSNILDSTKRK